MKKKEPLILYGNTARDVYLNKKLDDEILRSHNAEESLNIKIDDETNRATNREDQIENTSGNYLEIEQDEKTGIVTIKLLNIHGDILDTKELDLETEKIIKSVDLDYENKKLVFHLVDGTDIETDLSEVIDDFNSKLNKISEDLNAESVRAKDAEKLLTENLTKEKTSREEKDKEIEDNLNSEINRATKVEDELKNKQTRYFNRIVDGEYIDEQFENEEIVYCYNGSVVEGGSVPSTVIINFTQTSNKALYIKNIYIKYIDKNNTEQEYNYTFTSKTFTENNQLKELNDISWLLSDSNNVTYFAYNNSYGQQIGSGSLGIRNCNLTTTSFSDCTIKEIKITACGASSTNCKLSITVGGDVWLYNEGQSSESSNYQIPVNTISTPIKFTYKDGSTPGSGTIITYEETFLTKENKIISKIEPEEEIVYICLDNERIYLFKNNTLTEISKVLELGLTETTAYRGDFGNSNYQNICNILTGDTTFKGEKTFTGDVNFENNIYTEYDKSIYTRAIKTSDEDGGYSYLAQWQNETYYWMLHNIGWIGLKETSSSLTFMQSEDSSNPGYSVAPIVADSYRLMNIVDPINNTDGSNKKYVDNSVKDVSDILSAVIESEASRATEAESALQTDIDNLKNSISSEAGTRKVKDDDLQAQIKSNDEDITNLQSTKADIEGASVSLYNIDDSEIAESVIKTSQISNSRLFNNSLEGIINTGGSNYATIDGPKAEITNWSILNATFGDDADFESANVTISDPTTKKNPVSLNYLETNYTTKTYVDGEVDTLFEEITNETDRAIEKENELSSSIDTLNKDLLQEIEDRENADSELKTRVSTIESSYIKKDGSVSMTGNLNLNSNKITNLKNPESDTDAVNKQFLNTSIATAQSSLESKINTEISNRQTADSNLQSQIDAITSSSDVVDVVATKADLNSYDKSKLTDKDIIKVLKDESQSDKTTYYRFDNSTSSFTLIGGVGPYYTQSEVDTKINDVTSTLNQEITDRETQYNSLNDKIDDEIKTRSDETSSLSTTLNSEISDRKSEDSNLQEQITSNKTDITNLKTEVSNKVPQTRTINDKDLTQNITLSKTDIGLSNVDNTADKDKSVASSVVAQKLVDSTSSSLNVGATNKSIYFKDGVPVVGSYELNTNVPSDAVFTDTTYTLSADVDNNKIKLTPSIGNEQSITVPFATKASKDSSNNDITTTYATKTELNSAINTKQDTLVSGTNIKTINGQSLLGSEDIKIDSQLTYTLKQDSTDGHKIILEDSNGNSQSITVPDENTWRPIEDNLTSTSTTNSLSANQGKVLKDLVDTKITKEQANAYISLEDIEGEEGKVLSIVTI